MGQPGNDWACSAFGFTTILLQIHNLGLIDSTMPLVYGLFWGGAAQVIAGIIDGKRGDAFGLTAFCSYGVFWIGLATRVIFLQSPMQTDSAWTMIIWGIFTFFMMIATFKTDFVSFFVFATLVILFALLAAFSSATCLPKLPASKGFSAVRRPVYGGAAVIINRKFGRTVLPHGFNAEIR